MSDAHDDDQQPKPIAHLVQSRRTADEDRAWAMLYAAIHQPSAAEEVVKQLDSDPQSKRNHLALYIRAKTTLREQKAADARNQRIGAFVRMALTFLVVAPVRLLRRVLSISAGVAVEMLPATNRREPAKARSSVLKNDPAFAAAKERFSSSSKDAAQPAGDTGDSRLAA